MKKTALFSLLAITISLLSSSCGSGTGEEGEGEDSLTSLASDSVKAGRAQKVFHSIPSPIETATLLHDAGASYNKDLLNPIENVDKYNTASSQAINLGIYGTDLSFTSIFEKTQESMLYLKCVNKIAARLGITSFGEATIARLEKNESNNDSLLNIITDAFWEADAYLKENERPGTSALIVAGGWIEGLYLATQVAKITQNKDIIQRIGEQKLSLGNLVNLLESYKNEDEQVKAMLVRLNELNQVYEKVEYTQSETKTSTDTATGVTTIDNGSSITLSGDQLKTIYAKVEDIRKSVINP